MRANRFFCRIAPLSAANLRQLLCVYGFSYLCKLLSIDKSMGRAHPKCGYPGCLKLFTVSGACPATGFREALPPSLQVQASLNFRFFLLCRFCSKATGRRRSHVPDGATLDPPRAPKMDNKSIQSSVLLPSFAEDRPWNITPAWCGCWKALFHGLGEPHHPQSPAPLSPTELFLRAAMAGQRQRPIGPSAAKGWTGKTGP